MKQQLIHRAGFFLFYRQYEIGDILLGILGIAWGLWVANPLLDTFGLNSYLAFSQIAPEWVWGLLVFSLGLLTTVAAVCKHEYTFRAITLLLNIFMWSFVGVEFLMSEPANTGFVVYTVTAFTAIWLYLRLTIFTKMIEFSPKELKFIRKIEDR